MITQRRAFQAKPGESAAVVAKMKEFQTKRWSRLSEQRCPV